MLHLKLRVVDVKEEKPDHVTVCAILEDITIEDKKPPTSRIVHLGPIRNDEMVMEELGRQITEHFKKAGLCPMVTKPPAAYLALLMKRSYFQMLGRPTVGDYITFDARTLKNY